MTPGIPPLFTQCGELSGIGKLEPLPLEIQVCLCSPGSLPSPYPGPLHLHQAPSHAPCQFKSNPKYHKPISSLQNQSEATVPENFCTPGPWSACKSQSFSAKLLPPTPPLPPPSTAPWGGTGRSMRPLDFLGRAHWGLETLHYPALQIMPLL